MAEGIPLNDTDRWDWLVTLRDRAVQQLNAGADGVVLTCSALKRKYRDVIRIAGYNCPDVHVRFVYLRADEDVLLARVKARKGHYMKDFMVKSQINSLEEPDESERDVVSVDVSGPLPTVQRAALEKIEKCLAEDTQFVF
jgi:gluconokinase